MIADYQISEPFLFNPLKHHLGFIKEYINLRIDSESDDSINNLIRELKHLGTSVMDVYTGLIPISDICREASEWLGENNLLQRSQFSVWAGTGASDIRIMSLSDGSQWTLKYHDNEIRFVHLFPARKSRNTFRVKSNTLKTALLYSVIIGKDFITGDDVNKVRPLLGLSPIKDTIDTEAILEMIEILRD